MILAWASPFNLMLISLLTGKCATQNWKHFRNFDGISAYTEAIMRH